MKASEFKGLSENTKTELVLTNCPSTIEEANKELCYVYSQPNTEQLTVKYAHNNITNEHNCVCLGGTFDHLHNGHKVLLSLACLLTSNKLVIGVSSDELLVNKQYAEYIESYEQRVQTVRNFIEFFNSNLKVDIYPLHDSYGPTITISSIDVLVVSKETAKGGEAVNTKRLEIGYPKVEIVVADLVLGKQEKLSSTDIRAAIARSA